MLPIAIGIAEAAELAVAVGTGALAITTAISTRTSANTARAAARTAEASEALAAAETRPLLIDVTAQTPTEDGEFFWPDEKPSRVPNESYVLVAIDADGAAARCSIAVRNVGRGLAAITAARLYAVIPNHRAAPRLIAGPGPQPSFFFELRGRHPEITKRRLPPGETTRISFAFPAGDAASHSTDPMKGFRYVIEQPDRSFGVLLTYTDFSGAAERTTMAVISRTEARGWRVTDVEHDGTYSTGPYEASPWEAQQT